MIAGGENPAIRAKYDTFKTKEECITMAAADGYEFSIEQLEEVLRESGDSFESYGNPSKRSIWWHKSQEAEGSRGSLQAFSTTR